MKPTVFIGSSSEQLDVAEAIEVNLSPIADVLTWKHVFRAGQPYITELLNAVERSDFAVIVLTPDDKLQSRGMQFNTPRDNLIFEMGLFIGSLGKDRVFAVIDQNIETKIFSDYSGVSVLKYNGLRRDSDLRQALSPECVKIKAQIKHLGSKADKNEALTDKRLFNIDFGLVHVYKNYSDAEADLLADMSQSQGPVRLFFQIGSQSMSYTGTLFQKITDLVNDGRVEIRVLHAAPSSPLFSRDRLISLGKQPDRAIRTLKYVDESLRDLEAVASGSLRRRVHDYPFIWRLYGFSNKIYVMPYFSHTKATQYSPVLVFEKSEKSMYHSFVDWFDYAWNKSAPDKIQLDQLITPATPCGTALFLKWGDYHVFGIPKRDIIEGAEHVRFYGLGGKRKDPHERLDECALREGKEESGNAIECLVNSPSTEFYRSDGTIQRIDLITEHCHPRLVFEKTDHTGYGAMKKDEDYYYMIGFDASLSKKPEPSREIAALIFLNDRHLQILSRRNDVTLAQIIQVGAEISEQAGISINRRKILVPHGTASYLIRHQS